MIMSLKRLTLKSVLIVCLCFILMFSQTVPKAHAALPVILGGLALGEALFYTAAVVVGGYTVYEAYDHFKSDSLSAKFLKTSAKSMWNSLSESAKSAWAAAESVIDPAVTSTVELSKELWNQALLYGSALFATDRTITPAIPLPADSMNPYEQQVTVDNDFMVKYATLMFTMNGEEFALMPHRISKGSVLSYHWYAKVGDKWVSDYIPPAAAAFGAPKIYIRNSGVLGDMSVDISWKTFGSRIDTFSYRVDGWDNILITALDALPAMQAYLESVYGGLSVSVPVGWVPTIPKEKELTKPVAIPIPPGTITYPKVGEGSLSLDMDKIKTTVGDMTGDVAVPGQPPIDWNDTPSDKINFEPLKIGPIMTKKFPFSIPWDVGRQFAVFDVAPKSPVIKVDKTILVFGTNMNLKFNIDFSMFDDAVAIVRWFLIILFDLGMILSMRRFMPE